MCETRAAPRRARAAYARPAYTGAFVFVVHASSVSPWGSARTPWTRRPTPASERPKLTCSYSYSQLAAAQKGSSTERKQPPSERGRVPWAARLPIAGALSRRTARVWETTAPSVRVRRRAAGPVHRATSPRRRAPRRRSERPRHVREQLPSSPLSSRAPAHRWPSQRELRSPPSHARAVTYAAIRGPVVGPLSRGARASKGRVVLAPGLLSLLPRNRLIGEIGARYSVVGGLYECSGCLDSRCLSPSFASWFTFFGHASTPG